MNYAKHFSVKQTPQSEPIPGKPMQANSAGGFTFTIDKWARLDRFLILGSEGGTYYVAEKKLTVDGAKNVIACLDEDGERVVRRAVEISIGGRAPKNDPAIFVVALATAFGDAKTKAAAYAAISKVCRIGTHIFQFCQFVQDLRGWSKGLAKGVAKYYTASNTVGEGSEQNVADRIAYQLIKYRQRNGWTHRDVLRLAHVKPTSSAMSTLFKWAVGKPTAARAELPEIITAFEGLQKTVNAVEAARLIREYRLPREAVPTELLNSVDVWQALLDVGMPLGAMIRNLGKMTSVGLLTDGLNSNVGCVVKALGDLDALRKARIHPIGVLNALKVYSQGHGDRGKLIWMPVQQIVDALDAAFYSTFKTVEPTGKKHLLAVDVSGSMWGNPIAGTALDSATAAGAMALVTAAVEPQWAAYWFSEGRDGLAVLKISPRQRLDHTLEVMRRCSANMGRTDCALPMVFAAKNKLEVDSFVVLTDNETWAGDVQPCQALDRYRQKMGRPAKLIVVGMTATEFTIADPADGGSLDVVGFDTATPQIVADFIR